MNALIEQLLLAGHDPAVISTMLKCRFADVVRIRSDIESRAEATDRILGLDQDQLLTQCPTPREIDAEVGKINKLPRHTVRQFRFGKNAEHAIRIR
jgi:hypothetical protein